jgi:hypothetical protein
MLARFCTEKVEYVIEKCGYSRNGHFVQGEVKIRSLSIGQPAQFEINVGDYKQLIRTDMVMDIEKCPLNFKVEMGNQVHPYRIKVVNEKAKPITLMKIGTVKEVKNWIEKRFIGRKVTYGIEPIPTRLEAL